MRVLVTGAAGYIGSVLVRQLLNSNHIVIGFDILNFGDKSLLDIYDHPNFKFFKGDIRKEDDLVQVIKDVDSIVHLAAIVGDPACSKQPDLALETNWTAAKSLFDLSNSYSNIKRFVFASTCSNYGKMEGDGFVDENSPLKPVSLYAELKVKFEKYLIQSKTRNSFTPTSLRFSTAYGISPRIRFDLTVNEFIREVTFGKELIIFGEQFWRPYCDVFDLARACNLILESQPSRVNQNVFGVGDTKENYQKKMIAEEILKIIPDAQIKYVHKNEDPRDYRVDFSKIQNQLGYRITKKVPDGLKEIHSMLKRGEIKDPFSPIYQNI